MVELVSLAVAIVAVTVATYSTADAYRSRRRLRKIHRDVLGPEFIQKVKNRLATDQEQGVVLRDMIEQFKTNEIEFPKINFAEYAPRRSLEFYIDIEVRLLRWFIGSGDALYPWTSKNMLRAHREISTLKTILRDLDRRENPRDFYVRGHFLWRVVHWQQSQSGEASDTSPTLQTELEKIMSRAQLAQRLSKMGNMMEYRCTASVLPPLKCANSEES